MEMEFVNNWNSDKLRILVNGKDSNTCKVGLNNKLEGTDLVLFVFIHSVKPV